MKTDEYLITLLGTVRGLVEDHRDIQMKSGDSPSEQRADAGSA